MKNKHPRSRTRDFLTGALLFFFTTAVTVTITVFLYDSVNKKSGGNRGLIALTMLSCIVVIAMIYILIDYFRRKIMIDRPVERIIVGMEKIIAGDFSVRFELRHRFGRYDEYDIIMDNLNRMTAELSKNELLRNDFIANVSHEIKTPLAVIQNYAEVLKVSKLSAEEQRSYIETLISAAKRLSALVTNILKLNKLENQVIFSDKTAVDVGRSLCDTVLAFEDAIDTKAIDLRCDIAEGIVMLSDCSLLEIIWSNLVSNAIKFSLRGGVVTVTLKQEGAFAVIRIGDNGIGMSKETGERIFDKFYQGDTSHAEEGNGLGLALVKRVIDLIGGEISVESAVGKGSMFTVKLRKEK